MGVNNPHKSSVSSVCSVASVIHTLTVRRRLANADSLWYYTLCDAVPSPIRSQLQWRASATASNTSFLISLR